MTLHCHSVPPEKKAKKNTVGEFMDQISGLDFQYLELCVYN